MNKNSDIEILRALAITMGLLQHLPILAGPNVPALELMGRYFGFWGGVDLFFVISGFLITRLLFKYVDLIETGGDWLFELKTFWIKRAFRLMPAAWLWLVIPLLLAASIPNILPPLQTLTNDALAALLNVADFYWPYCVAGGKAGTWCSNSATLLPYWSLSLEEQFYVALPALLLVVRRRWLVPVIIAALVALLAWSRPLFSLGWFLRIDALLWGMLLALLSTLPSYALFEPRKLLNSWLRPFVFIGLGCLICAVPRFLGNLTFTSFGTPSSMTIGVLAMSCALAVYIASFGKDYLFPVGRVKQALVGMGARSYAIYLVHVPCYEVARAVWPRVASAWRIDLDAGLYLSATLFIAVATELTHRLVELPSRNLGRRMAKRFQESRNNDTVALPG